MTVFTRPHTIFRIGLFFALILLFLIIVKYNDTKLLQIDLRFMPSSCGNTKKARLYRMHSICKCARSNIPQLVSPYQTGSACSEHATSRGPGQKVIAYSFYGTVKSKYFEGTEVNIKRVAQFYPGWVMRLYNNISLSNETEVEVLCNLWCTYPHFDLCDVTNLPPPLCDQSKVFGMIWRFFVLGDALVDRFMVRDLDSEIYQREADAVHAWEESGQNWHAMRDHPNHYLPILGGMWGGTNSELNTTMQMRNEMIKRGKNWVRGYDQDLLQQIVWRRARKDFLQHDSYRCLEYNQSIPWPTKRVQNKFVGAAFPWQNTNVTLHKCPKVCRPIRHKNWIYC